MAAVRGKGTVKTKPVPKAIDPVRPTITEPLKSSNSDPSRNFTLPEAPAIRRDTNGPNVMPFDPRRPAETVESINPVMAPNRTTIAGAYGDVQKTGIIPQFNPITAAPISAIDTSQYGPIQGFGDDYYKNLSDQAAKRLRDQYFTSDNSLTNQFTNTMSKRGLIGSGIETGGLNNIYKDFGSQMADVESQLLAEKAQNDLALATSNRDFGYKSTLDNKDIERFNAEQGIDVAGKNADIQAQLAELGLGAAGDEARSATEFDTKIFGANVDQINAEREQRSKLIEQLNSALGNKLIDADTRQMFENLFGTDIFNQLGYPINIKSIKPPKNSKKSDYARDNSYNNGRRY